MLRAVMSGYRYPARTTPIRSNHCSESYLLFRAVIQHDTSLAPTQCQASIHPVAYPARSRWARKTTKLQPWKTTNKKNTKRFGVFSGSLVQTLLHWEMQWQQPIFYQNSKVIARFRGCFWTTQANPNHPSHYRYYHRHPAQSLRLVVLHRGQQHDVFVRGKSASGNQLLCSN